MIVLAPARAQDHQTAHGASTLYVAQMSGEAVAPEPVATAASATGAFVLEASRERITLDYDLTYDALDEPVRRIVLRNAGEGGIGEVVHVVCGHEAERACPGATGGTLSGRWTSDDEPPLTFDLVREIAALRTYVEVETGDAEAAAIRGQLTTNRSMIMADGFVARLRPEQGEAGDASGTAAVFVKTFPDGTEEVDYSLTVTGLEAPVAEADIISDIAQPSAAERMLALAEQALRAPSGASRAGSLASPGAFSDLVAPAEGRPARLTVRVEGEDGTVLSGDLQRVP